MPLFWIVHEVDGARVVMKGSERPDLRASACGEDWVHRHVRRGARARCEDREEVAQAHDRGRTLSLDEAGKLLDGLS